MKNISSSYSILLFIILLGTQGCKKNFFDLYPTDELSPVTFWQTESDAVAALTGCYNSLSEVNSNFLPYLDVLTPNAFNEYPWEGWKDISKGTHTALGPNGPYALWSGSYAGIGRVNTFIANIDKPEMDEETRTKMKSEALFLRAYYYFTLATYFGGVPLITDPPALEQATMSRNSKAEVICQVLSDLDVAAPGLPVTVSPAENGHASRGAAIALKTRVALYEKDWATAASSAQTVKDLGV